MAETKGSTVEQAKETGSELVTQAKEQVGARAAEVRSDAAFQLREQVEERSTQAGEQIHAVGQALRAGVDELRTDGKGASADVVDMLARRADDLGAYLQSTDAERILDDVERFARRRPWLTAGAAAVAGFVASRVVKASSDRRYERSSSGSLAAGATR